MEELTQDGAQLARTMLMSAAQLAESMARVQAQRAWMAQSRLTAQAAQAQQQIAAERDAARMIFRPLTDDGYWQNAPQLDRVVQAYMTAASWAQHDPEACAAVQLIKQHAEERWSRAEVEKAHVPDPVGADHDHEHSEMPMTAKQRKLLGDLGVEPSDALTKAEASQAIRGRLQVSTREDTSQHHAEVSETVHVESIARQADARLDRLGDLTTSSTSSTTVDDEAQLARRKAEPAIAKPIRDSLHVGLRRGNNQQGAHSAASVSWLPAKTSSRRAEISREIGK